MTSTEEFRIEHDTMGEVRVPVNALYRAQTQRAVENFPISGKTLERAHIEALARVKKAAAQANAELGVLDGELAKAIADAADEVAAGKYDGDFPIDVFQTGSGTSSNMNTNEVIAELASRALKAAGSDKVVHPNDHVNASQSSNDVFPTSVHVAATSALINDLIPALGYLAESLERKAVEFKDVVKSGRTHLMDATPVTLGQEFGGYAAQVRYGIERINASLPRVAEVPLGGTAVGTGINTPAGFPERVIELLATDTGLPLTEARDHFEAQANRDGLIEASSQLRNIAISFMKINNDLRWMGSGPNTGLGEIAIPDLQPGSSIMPGKVNPVICEASIMVASAGHRQRHRHRLVRHQRRVRAERRHPRDGRQPARVRPPAGEHQPRDGGQDDRRHHSQRGACPLPGRSVAVHRDAAEQVHRLRKRRQDRQEGRCGRAHHS
ncbi:fumarate hydratase class II [Arthrobacter sp. V1I9]|nr:fumarate hydratase class II [Arthrobacter sp. V1I9]